MTISQRILEIMEKKHIKQKTLADYTGISTSAISDWKKKGTNPSVDKIVAISECLGVSVDYLLGRTDKPNNIQSTKQQDQVTTELLRVFENLSFKDKISVLNYALNIENTPSQIVQNSKPPAEEVEKPKPVQYVARTFDGKNTKGVLHLTQADLDFLEANKIQPGEDTDL